MTTSAERLARLGRIWGLVGLGALSYCAVRFALVVMYELANIRLNTDWRVLGARMSQLKPVAFKAGPLSTYAELLAGLLALVGIGLFALAIYALVRPDAPPDEIDAED